MSKENITIYKFQFDAHVGKLILPIKFACKIKLTWKRSSQMASIQPINFTNGVLDFNQNLSLNVNMYFDNTQKIFLEKKSLFSLTIITEKGQKAAGYVTIDFAQKLNQKIQQYSKVYPLQKCPMKQASLQVSIISHPISQQSLDSMSQMTTANQSAQQSMMQTESAVGQSFLTDKEDKYSHPTRDDRSDLASRDVLQGNSISDNLLRINDVSSKINDFVTGFSSNIKTEFNKLKERNKGLEEKLREANDLKQQLEANLQTEKTQNRQLRNKIQNSNDDHSNQMQRLNASLIQATSRIEQAEQSKKALQSANLAGENEKIQYLNEQLTHKQQALSRLTESKADLEQKLNQQKRQTNELKSKISNLQAQFASLQQKYSSLNALKNEIQSERRNNQEQVQAAKQRLQRVYQQMLASLKDII